MSLRWISSLFTLRTLRPRLAIATKRSPGVILNYAEDGRLSSVEVLDASHRYPSGQLAAYCIDELIDLRTASGLSGIAPVTLRAQAEKGRMRALRLAGHCVTTREQLQQYIDSRSRSARAAD
jgi:hypothetical protein